MKAGVFASSTLFWLIIVAACIVAWTVYQPGLYGTFIFDDYANLPNLGFYGPVENWTTFIRYITSGNADPTGRPLSLLTFLLDARDWPADPYPFKRTNVILHVINALLLGLTFRRLGRLSQIAPIRCTDVAAAFTASLWLLHPLWVSTTLYIVQREAMLPVTCLLLGALGYVHGFELAVLSRKSGVWIAGLSVLFFTVLGTASKANGALLPLLIWLIDSFLLSRAVPISEKTIANKFRWMRRGCLILPSICLIAWLIASGIKYGSQGIIVTRGWSITQRLLTETRIVCDYLRLLWFPHPYTAGLFNDAVQVSTGLYTPPTTFLASLFISGLVFTAILLRKRTPAFSLAVLFFAIGHLLESTVIPLELYYEHRNYLPALFMFWPLGLWLTSDEPTNIVARRTLVFVIPLALATMTYQSSTLWGDAHQQGEMWAAKNPQSPRAQAYAGQLERDAGRPDLAISRLRGALVPPDEDIQLALNLLGAECEVGQVEDADIERSDRALRSARVTGQLGYSWFSEAIQRVAGSRPCRGIDVAVLKRLLDAADANPSSALPGRRQDNYALRGQLALAEKDPDSALAYFIQALDADPRPDVGLTHAALLASTGNSSQALALLDHLDRLPFPKTKTGWTMQGLHQHLLIEQGYWESEVTHLRAVIQSDMSDKKVEWPLGSHK